MCICPHVCVCVCLLTSVYYIGRLRDKQLFNESSPLADEGMTLTGAIDALSLKGACLQASWPFDLARLNQAPPEEAFVQAMHYKISEAKEIPTSVTAMKACLAEGFPIIFGLKLTKKVRRRRRRRGTMSIIPQLIHSAIIG
jgi:hypothetical protein